MMKRVVFAVVGLALLFGALDAGAAAADTTFATPAGHHASAITAGHDATVVTPAGGSSRQRRVTLLDACIAVFAIAALGAAFGRAGNAFRNRASFAQYSIWRRGPPVLLVVS